MKMDPFRLAQKLHSQLVQETSELQQRIVLQEALIRRFEHEALPTERMMQGYLTVLTNAPESVAKGIKRYEERIAENLEVIRELELRFAEKDEADMQAFAEWFKRRMKEK